jgi:ABC-2 type transport system permease protein
MMEKIMARYRYSYILLRQLVKTDFKLRYQGSVLGYLWSLLRPLAIFVIMYTVFLRFLKVDFGVPHPEIYLLTGLVLWNYFGEVTSGSVTAIVGRGDILRKINFPKYVIILSGSFAALINLLLNLCVVGVFMVVSKVAVGSQILLAPLLILELFVFAIALAFFLSALYVRFRDVNYVWEVIMQAAFYATPIFYPLAVVPQTHHIAQILMASPVAQIIQDFRHVVVTTQSPTIATVYGSSYARLIPVCITLVVVVVAALYFRKRSRNFAEEI